MLVGGVRMTQRMSSSTVTGRLLLTQLVELRSTFCWRTNPTADDGHETLAMFGVAEALLAAPQVTVEVGLAHGDAVAAPKPTVKQEPPNIVNIESQPAKAAPAASFACPAPCSFPTSTA